MSMLTNAAETDLLKLLLQNVNWAGIGDATGLRGSSVAGVFWLSLHTGDPGETGSQTTSEATYGAYARISVVRGASTFPVSGDTGDNADLLLFDEATSGDNDITYVGIGTDETGTGYLIGRIALTTPRNVVAGVQPKFNIGSFDLIAA